MLPYYILLLNPTVSFRGKFNKDLKNIFQGHYKLSFQEIFIIDLKLNEGNPMHFHIPSLTNRHNQYYLDKEHSL